MTRYLPIIASLILWLTTVSGCATSRWQPRTLPPTGDEPKYLSNITQLTSQEMGLFKSGEGYFSPDGRTIIFQAFPMGASEYQIYTMDLKTRKLKMVSTGKGACTCSFFHPSGEKIIFASTHLDPDLGEEREEDPQTRGGKWKFHKYMNIFEASPDGSNLRPLTTGPAYDAEGSYSPDGERIVFTSNRDGDLEIYVMNADGTDQRRYTNGKGYDGGPFFSPDGETILYRGDRRNDNKMNLQLRLVDANGTNDRAITDNQLFNWSPYWYPTGNCLIFVQVDHAAHAHGQRLNYDLFVRSVEDETLTRITYDAEFDGLPVFSPDGTKLMWTSKRGPLDEAQLFIADFRLPERLR